MHVDLPEPTGGTRSQVVHPEAQTIPDAGPVTVESRDGRDPGGNAATDTNSAAFKPESLRGSSSQEPNRVQNQASTGVKQGNGKKTTLRREPSGGIKPVKVRTGPFLLQVRLTNGETIQGTFESHQLLRDVKNFVDLQRTDGNMAFRLAVPFPRKLFSEEGNKPDHHLYFSSFLAVHSRTVGDSEYWSHGSFSKFLWFISSVNALVPKPKGDVSLSTSILKLSYVHLNHPML